TTIELGKEDTELNFPLQRGKPLRIRFVDVAGKPIPEVFVTIDRWRNARGLYNQRNVNGLQSGIPSQADKEGLFTWTWAPDDPISFSFHKEGYHVAQNQILTAGEEVEVKLAGDGE